MASRPSRSGSVGVPPGGTTTPREELADGGPQGLPEARTAKPTQRGAEPQSRRRTEAERQKARPGAAKPPDGAPRGATRSAKAACKRTGPRLLARRPPRFLQARDLKVPDTGQARHPVSPKLGRLRAARTLELAKMTKTEFRARLDRIAHTMLDS